MKYTQGTLDKIEGIAQQCDYIIRYERGTFNSGYCILEQKKVIVLNKFLDTEARINTLTELIPKLNIEIDRLTHDAQNLYQEIMKNSLAA